MQTYLDLLQQLIRLRPVSTDIAAVNRVIDTIHNFLKDHGVRCIEENVNGRKTLFASTAEGKTPDLLLNAHADVVPAATEDQFEPCIKDGWIYGRGSDDCLGNAVCIIKTLCEADSSLSIGAIFSSDEEIGGETTKYMAEHGYLAKKLICILDCWCNHNIVYAQKGIIVVKLTAHGKGGHASAPWAYENPVEKLIDGYCKIKAAWGPNPTADDQWHKTLAATVLNAGMVCNQIPDTAEMQLNIRYIVPEEKDQIIDLLNLSGLEVSVSECYPPVFLDKDLPVFKTLSDAFAGHNGFQPEFKRMNGATDARWFASYGIPIAIFGIQGEGCHGKIERSNIASIETYSKILLDFAKDI